MSLSRTDYMKIYSSIPSLKRYIPEPRISGAKVFNGLLKGAQDVSNVVSGGGGMEVNIAPEYRELIEKQLEVQEQMAQVTMTSNIEKTNHESRMSSIRNMRVS